MIAPFATLLFLAVLWTLVSLMNEMLSGRGSRVLAALRGEARPELHPAVTVTMRARRSATQRPVLRARPQLRAAA